MIVKVMRREGGERKDENSRGGLSEKHRSVRAHDRKIVDSSRNKTCMCAADRIEAALRKEFTE